MKRKGQDMAHAAKKIGHGHYEYRGHQIEEVGRYGNGDAAWNITHNNEISAHDTTETLKDAKGLIDYWFDVLGQ